MEVEDMNLTACNLAQKKSKEENLMLFLDLR